MHLVLNFPTYLFCNLASSLLSVSPLPSHSLALKLVKDRKLNYIATLELIDQLPQDSMHFERQQLSPKKVVTPLSDMVKDFFGGGKPSIPVPLNNNMQMITYSTFSSREKSLQLKKAESNGKGKRMKEDLVFKERRKREQNLIFSTSVNHVTCGN